jgi:hypothetical protein
MMEQAEIRGNLRRMMLALPLCRQLRFAGVIWRQNRSGVYKNFQSYLTSCLCADIAAIALYD